MRGFIRAGFFRQSFFRLEDLNRHGTVTAVHNHFLSRDEAASPIGGQQQGCADEFIGGAKAVHGGVPHDLGNAVWGEDFFVLLSREEAGNEGIHPYAQGGPFACQVLAQVMNGPFGHAVSKDTAQRQEARHGAEINDGGIDLLLDEVFAENLAGEEHALGIDAHDTVVFIFGDIEEGRGGIDPGTVDQDVTAAGALQDLIQEELQIGFA